MFRSNSDISVHIYESEYRAIVAEARHMARTETGGDLYGTFTHGSRPIIWLASGPGQNVRHEQAHFEQDTEFTTYWEARMTRDFGLQYIGSWHSHHFLGLQQPSSGDVRAAQTYARQHNRQTTLEIIVNHELLNSRRGGSEFSTTLRPYFYPNAQNAGYVLSNFVILAGESPIRRQLDNRSLATLNRVPWREATGDFRMPVVQATQSSEVQSTSNDEMVVIPDILGGELQSIADSIEELDIQQNSNNFMMSIALSSDVILAVIIRKEPELKITQINLIDKRISFNEDVTSSLQEKLKKKFVINRNNIGILKRILLEIPSIHRVLTSSPVVLSQTASPAQNLDFDQNSGANIQIIEAQLLATIQQLQEQRSTSQRREAQIEAQLFEMKELEEKHRIAQREIEEQRREAQRQIENQKTEITQLQAQLDIAQQSFAAQKDIEMQLVGLKQQLADEQHLTEEQKQQMVGLKDAQQKLEEREREVQDHRELLQAARQKLSEQEQLANRLIALQQQLEMRERRTEELENRLQGAQQKLSEQEQLANRLTTLQQQLEMRERRTEELENRLREAQQKLSEQEQLANRLTTLQQQLEAQKYQAQQLDTELRSTKEQLEVLQRVQKRQFIRFSGNRSGPGKLKQLEIKRSLIIEAAVAIIIILGGAFLLFRFFQEHTAIIIGGLILLVLIVSLGGLMLYSKNTSSPKKDDSIVDK